MKHLVLYHANCTDGFGAAFAAWWKLGYENTIYAPVHYDSERDWVDFLARDLGVDERTTVYVLDFSFDRKTTDWLRHNALHLVWLDHHKTAFEMWCTDGEREFYTHEATDGSFHITLDNNKSGALLAWEHFMPDTPVPLLIRHIDDRDRWVFKIDGTREFNAALRSWEPWSFEQWQTLLRESTEQFGGSTGYYVEVRNQGHAILRAHDRHVQSIARGAKKCWIKAPAVDLPGSFLDGVVPGWEGGLVVNCPPAFTSDVGHKLAKDCGTFGLMWHTVDGVEARCSLRSDGDYDVSAIAKAFGGGGHKNAAGFSVPLADLLKWYKEAA